MTCFYSDRRLAAGGRGVFEITRGRRVFRSFGRDDYVIESEGENHLARDAILLGVARFSPIAVGSQAFIDVAAVQVDQMIASLDNLLRDEIGSAFCLRAVPATGIEAIHVFAIDGIEVSDLLLE